MCRGSVVIERLGVFLSTCMQPGQPDLEEADIALVRSCMSIINKRQLGVDNLLQNDSIRGTMKTEGSMRVASDECLPRVVAKAQLDKATAAAGKDFMGKWSKSTKE